MKPSPVPGQVLAVGGALMLLSAASPLHRGYRVGQLMNNVWPSIMRGQFCLYHDRDSRAPVGFCNWLWVSDAVLQELYEEKRDPRPDDWDTGDNPFFPEMIAPFGQLKKIIGDLRDHAMAGVPWAYSVRGVMQDQDGDTPQRRSFKWKGRSGTARQPGQRSDPIRYI